DVFRTERAKDLAASRAQRLEVEPYHVQVIGVLGATAYRQRPYSRQLRERGVIPRGNLPAPCNERRKPLELLKAERALDIGYAVVVSQLHHVVRERPLRLALTMVADDPMVAEDAHPVRKRRLVGDDRSALPRRHVLDRMEGEARQARKGADGASVRGPADRMTRVGDQRNAAWLQDRSERVVVGWLAGIIDRDHRACPRRDRTFC